MATVGSNRFAWMVIVAFFVMTCAAALPSVFAQDDEEEIATDRLHDVSGCVVPCTNPLLDLASLSASQDDLWLTLSLRTRNDPLAVVTASEGDIVSVVEFFVAGHHIQLRGTTDARFPAFSLLEIIQGHGRPGGPEGYSSQDMDSYLRVPAEAKPWHYDVQISKLAFADWRPSGGSLVLDRVSASILTVAYSPQSDRMPDVGYATESYALHMGAVAALDGDVHWDVIEADDFATGTSLAWAKDGFHLAYVVDDDSRDTPVGLYHAVVSKDGIAKEKVADIRLPDRSGQAQTTGTIQFTSTAMAIDGDTVAIAAYPAPHQGGGLRVWMKGTGDWSAEDPAEGAVADSYRDIPALAARSGRLVVAYQAPGDTLVLRERGAAGWTTLQTIEDARYPRLALDGQGKVHLAYFRPVEDQGPNRALYGSLLYRSEPGWKDLKVVDDIEDRTLFWETAETDGSFAFALDPQGNPAFVYETDGGERKFARLVSGNLETEPSPLKPVHGNIQNRMRMVFDSVGRAHIASGYGDADLYAIRYPDGSWVKMDANRYGMFQIAVDSNGHAAIAGTQPHGGRTMALAKESTSPDDLYAAPEETPVGGEAATQGPSRARSAEFIPAQNVEAAPTAGVALLLSIFAVAVAMRRRET